MGVKKFIQDILGISATKEARREADSEDLIALSRVCLTLETELGYEPDYIGGIAFSNVQSQDFKKAVDEVEGVITANKELEGTKVRRTETNGTRWIVIESDTIDGLVSDLQYGASAMESVDRSSRLLAAVLPLRRDEDQYPVYLVYSFNRGKFYPYAPKGTSGRDREKEERLVPIIDDAIDVEDNREYWYPIRPSGPNKYPWE